MNIEGSVKNILTLPPDAIEKNLKSIKENIEEAFKIDIWKMLKKLLNRAKEIKTDINDIK